MDYITAREAAEKWNISERLVQKYCSQDRIDGTKSLVHRGGYPPMPTSRQTRERKTAKRI